VTRAPCSVIRARGVKIPALGGLWARFRTEKRGLPHAKWSLPHFLEQDCERRHSGERYRVKSLTSMSKLLITLSLALGFAAGGAHAQERAASPAVAAKATTGAASNSAQLQKAIEDYLRHLYAFGPDVEVHVSEPKETPVAGLLLCDVKVKIENSEETGKFYVSKDGKYLFRGDLSDLSKDPLAENRAAMKTKNAPAMGSSNATVTVVEYSDFECPVCRSLHDVMRGLLPNYPQVRLVFMDYPLEQIHPWARTAALAGRCAYDQNPQSFWKMYDLIYDNQDVIAAGNAYQKMTDYATQTGLNLETFKSCMAGSEAAAAVDASIANGHELEISSTPTIFVNGRRIVGADPHALEQYIKYELAQQKSAK
jgi:protein-disulfide isomerase